MAEEKVINDKTAPAERGTVIGSKEPPKPFPGLVPVAKKLHEVTKEVAALEATAYELGRVRATLLLNFGDTKHNRYGFKIGDGGDSTHALLMIVLEQLCRNVGPAAPAAAPDKKEGK